MANINLTTGDVTLIGNQGSGWTGLAIHPTSGKTYTVSRRRDEESNTAHLYEIDNTTGFILEEPDGHIGDTGIRAISDIDFAPDGTLYGSWNLEVINITTGQATTVGHFGGDPLEPLSQNNSIENNVMQTAQGSINFTGSIILPSAAETDVSSERVEISFNEAKVDSIALPFLDEPARITLTGLSGTEKTFLVDKNDDGTFEPCLSSQCTLDSFAGGTLIFDVPGFTTYSSVDKTLETAITLALAEIDALLIDSEVSKKARKKLKKAEKKLKKAEKKLEKALDKLEKGDVKKSTKEISKAVKELLKAEKEGAEVADLIDILVAATRTEAENAIETAIALDGKPKDIEKAQRELIKAQKELDKGKPDKAIDHYGHAWGKAQKAIKRHRSPKWHSKWQFKWH